MDFKYCPYFAFADHVVVRREGDTWTGIDSDGAEVRFSDEGFLHALELQADEAGNGLYAVPDPLRKEARRFLVDHKEGIVHVENGERPVPINDFIKHALRADSEGKPICSFMQPLHEQRQLCEGRTDGDLHLHDISAFAEAKRTSEAVGDRIDAGLYDIVTSGLDDGLDFMEIMRKVTDASGKPVHETTALRMHMPAPWHEIREFPQYMLAPIRALFGSYMEERLGEFPIERVSRLQAPVGFPLSLHFENFSEIVSEDDPFEGGNIIPGYRTSPVIHFRGEGFDAIVFSDFAGTYAYAWPTPAAPRHNPQAPGM